MQNILSPHTIKVSNKLKYGCWQGCLTNFFFKHLIIASKETQTKSTADLFLNAYMYVYIIASAKNAYMYVYVCMFIELP